MRRTTIWTLGVLGALAATAAPPAAAQPRLPVEGLALRGGPPDGRGREKAREEQQKAEEKRREAEEKRREAEERARERRDEAEERAREGRERGEDGGEHGDEGRERGDDGRARGEEGRGRGEHEGPPDDAAQKRREGERELAAVARQEAHEREKHAWRVVRLERLRELAAEQGKTDKVAKVDRLIAEEQARFEKKLAKLDRKRADIRRKKGS